MSSIWNIDDIPEHLREFFEPVGKAVSHATYGEFKGTPEHATNMNGEQLNPHPTLKPISLVKYLSTLLAPPEAYAPRRILIPFSGSGSEIIGAILSQQWEEIIGVEMNEAYCKIAEARLAWWSQWPGWGQVDVDKILAASTEQQEAGQLPLFAHRPAEGE